MKKILILFVCSMLMAGCGSSGDNPGSEPTENIPAQKPVEPGSLVGKSIVNFSDTGLVNQSDQPVGLETLPGKPVLISFIFTRCPMAEMCPLVTSKMAQLQGALNKLGKKPVHFVSVTMDPQYDTPAVLKRYGEQYKVDFDNWEFWTGELENIEALMSDFKIYVRRQNSMPVSHNMRTYLLGPDHTVRFWHRGSNWEVETVKSQLLKLVNSS